MIRSDEVERKRVRLNAMGGSRGVVVPKPWLEGLGLCGDLVDLVRTPEGIMITAPALVADSIEDEPAFSVFLNFVGRFALNCPEQLVTMAELTAGHEALFVGVDPDL